MNGPNLINFALFQVTWFSCVLGAAQGLLWPGAVAFAIMFAWQMQPTRKAYGDWGLVLVAALLGLILDSLWIQLGILEYEAPLLLETIAPVWILLLWMSLALTLNHSLGWLKERLALAAALSALASPISYYAGQRLEALTIQVPFWEAALILGGAWAACMPLLLFVAKNMRKPELNEVSEGP